MKKEIVATLQSEFNAIANIIEDGRTEYWYARDLQKVLGYQSWDKFQNVIDKAKDACENSNVDIADHFRHVGKMVSIGSEATRTIDDIMLTRYACYERSVDEKGFGRIRFKGDSALFGGYATQAMKDKLEVPDNRSLADFLPTITITAKNLATEITNHNVKQNDLQGENSISNEHIQNNESIRGLLVKRGIKPEELARAEDLKKLERRVKSDEKKLIKESALPKDKK